VELARSLDRDHVARLLHDADRARLAALVLADAAGRLGGEVEADLALSDRLLDLADGIGKPERLLLGRAQDVKGETLRGALPDAGQAGELGDQAVDGRCEQTIQRTPAPGRSGSGLAVSRPAGPGTR
jgi:hypothetical protein